MVLDPIMTAEQVAEALKTSPKTIYRLASASCARCDGGGQFGSNRALSKSLSHKNVAIRSMRRTQRPDERWPGAGPSSPGLPI
jgi:hypothetical protein